MECLDSQELVRYACRDLDDAEEALARGHIRACPACQSEVALLAQIVDGASNLGRTKLSAGRARAVMRAAEGLLPLDPVQREEVRQERVRMRTVRFAPAPALAACVLVAVSLAGFLAPCAHPAAAPVISIEDQLDDLLRDGRALSPGCARHLLTRASGVGVSKSSA